MIKSYTGNQCHGLEMIHRRHHRSSTEINDNAVAGFDDFLIVLGKNVNGVEYAPDFSRFANPQIKITWDYSITTAWSGATFDSDASPAMQFTVIAKVFRETGHVTHGYLKSTQIDTWTSANSTTTQVLIPRGEKLYGLGIEAGYDDDDWTEDIEQIKFDLDNGAFIPLDIFEDEIVKIQEEWFENPFSVTFTSDLKDGVEIDSHMGWVASINFQTIGALTQGTVGWPVGHKGVEEVVFKDSGNVAVTVYEQVGVHVTGFMPYGLWYMPMWSIQGMGSDLLDTTQFSRINLETVSGNSVNTSSTPAVLAEFLVTQ